MAYTGKKPVDVVDVTESQSLTVSDDLTVDTNTLYVDSTNNRVGIGTSSLSRDLTVAASVGGLGLGLVGRSSDDRAYTIYYENDGTTGVGSIYTIPSSNTFNINAYSGNSLSFNVDGSERMRITNGGTMILGTGSSAETYANQRGVVLKPVDATYVSISHANGVASGNSYMLFTYNAGIIGSITQSGTTGVAYNTSSDYRLKENVTGITDGIERVKQLNPSRFNFIADADTTVDGFLAHEAATVVPEAVSGEKDAMRDEEYEVTPAVLDDDGNVVTEAVMGTRSVPDYQGIDQAKLVPLLTAALQEAITKIETLETKVAALEAAD